jgi:LacI family transcriptional regulator
MIVFIMRRTNAPTLQDVARESGVTAMTVSVVLNGARSATRVSDATRTRIQEAATRLRYRPNAVARGLSRRRMDTIGVVSIIDGNEVNLYFLEVLNGILEGAARHGQNTTVFSIADWSRDESRILQFCDGRVDGIILIGPQRVTPSFADSLLHHSPFVMIHGNQENPNADDLDVDNEGGAYAIVRYLIELGHRRIAHFAGWQDLLGARQRLSGYRRAVEDSEIGYDEALVVPGVFSVESGREAMSRLLAQRTIDPLPTAVFCGSDAIASGAIEVLSDHGLRVPEDISIAGFDDMLLARMTTPPLTTIRQPLRQMGQFAVERLLYRIKESKDESSAVQNRFQGREKDTEGMANLSAPHTEIFPVELVVRGSAGPPPADLIIL